MLQYFPPVIDGLFSASRGDETSRRGALRECRKVYMKVDVSREVNCPQQIAFEYYSDRDADLEWWSGTLATTVISDIRSGIGERSRQLQTIPGLPIKFEVEIEVIAWDPPHRWREVSESGLCRYDVWYEVEPLDDARSRVRLHGDCELKGWYTLVKPIANRLLMRLTERNFDRLQSKLNDQGARLT